jgi:hypothetical protein
MGGKRKIYWPRTSTTTGCKGAASLSLRGGGTSNGASARCRPLRTLDVRLGVADDSVSASLAPPLFSVKW